MTRVNTEAIMRLADTLEDKQTPLDAMITRLQEVVTRIDTGAPNVDTQTRSAADLVGSGLDRAGEVFQGIADAMDMYVDAVVARENDAEERFRQLMEGLRQGTPSGPVSGVRPPGPGPT